MVGSPSEGSKKKLRFSTSTLLLAALPAVMAGLGLGVWLLSVRDRLPEVQAVHWGSSGEADGFGSFTENFWTSVAVTVGVGVVIGFSFAMDATATALRRFGVVLGSALAGFISALMVAGVAPQIDQVTSQGTRMDWVAAWPIMVGGLVLGILLQFLVRPPKPEQAANRQMLPESAVRNDGAAARGETISVRLHVKPWIIAVTVLVAAIIFGFLASSWIGWLIVGALLCALLLGFLIVTVRADSTGIRVLAWGLVPILHVPVADLWYAEAQESVRPWRLGGWGLRVTADGMNFVLNSGPALLLHNNSGGKSIVSLGTLQRAKDMAALANDYAAQASSQASQSGGAKDA